MLAAGVSWGAWESGVQSRARLCQSSETRLTEDGELLVRGPFLMKGYRNDPAKTAEGMPKTRVV